MLSDPSEAVAVDAVPDAFVFSISVLKMNSVFFASCNRIRFNRARGVRMPFSEASRCFGGDRKCQTSTSGCQCLMLRIAKLDPVNGVRNSLVLHLKNKK